MTPAASAVPARDLLSRPWARAAWCGFALLAIVGVFAAEPRAALWTLAFGGSGLLCLANAIRSRRFHCIYTGPIFLLGALSTLLRTAGVISISWAWIGSAVFVGVAGALVWERIRHGASTNRCC